jgi:hypothetical protein
MPATPLRMGELVGTLALAQDNAVGQPLESQLRSCLLAVCMGEKAGFDRDLRDTVDWVGLLRYLGCTGHAHEVSTPFGDGGPAAAGAGADRPDGPGGGPGLGVHQLGQRRQVGGVEGLMGAADDLRVCPAPSSWSSWTSCSGAVAPSLQRRAAVAHRENAPSSGGTVSAPAGPLDAPCPRPPSAAARIRAGR